LPDAIIAADPKFSAAQADSNPILWLALTLTPGLGPTRSGAWSSSSAPWTASSAHRSPNSKPPGYPCSRRRRWLGSVEFANEETARAAAADVRLLAFDDPAYPTRLRQIYDPPLVLYMRGNSAALSLPGVAVVGTCHPTPYGTRMAERLSCDLATRSLVIFSGLAHGVDTAAHRGAIAGKGKTVAMFGTGVDVLYPKENSRLSEQILSFDGALVSAFPLGTFAAPQNFPIRNRIISGISLGELVVEAAEYSGTRITARCALEQGRDV